MAAVVGPDGTPTTGTFRFWFTDQRWEWSDEVMAIHGYGPGTVTPTTELMLKHKHPDDREQVADAITEAVTNGRPFSSSHRIIDTAGRVHQVLVLSSSMLDADGNVIGSAGYYVDLTDTFDERIQESLDETIADVVSARAVIEQAKGVLMRVYRINAEQAFRVLRWRSQETNVKLRALAAQLIAELTTMPPSTAEEQTAFDHMLLTLHERIDPDCDG
ncbi:MULTISPECIES: PAS and ANTAR domain-containing protein [unclassified Nocardia]|uniref:PAS and ANTAR domain-containing protein n=1 Tax=unclassified Nocardia TaxID=2637762 RepID=UPI001CE3C164|nr:MULTISPECIES: PAS and ANTAR domain-containing protein [unclassified Nocardia]